MRLTDLLALSHVPRWVIVPRFVEQSVADHSFRVAVIYLELCERLNYPPVLTDLKWALYHDGAEARSGDISAKFKEKLREVTNSSEPLAVTEYVMARWYQAEVAAIADEGSPLVKLADMIEAYTWIVLNGRGRHAANVADELRAKTYRQFVATLTAIGKQGVHGDLLLALFEDIIEERER